MVTGGLEEAESAWRLLSVRFLSFFFVGEGGMSRGGSFFVLELDEARGMGRTDASFVLNFEAEWDFCCAFLR